MPNATKESRCVLRKRRQTIRTAEADSFCFTAHQAADRGSAAISSIPTVSLPPPLAKLHPWAMAESTSAMTTMRSDGLSPEFIGPGERLLEWLVSEEKVRHLGPMVEGVVRSEPLPRSSYSLL